MAVKRGWRGSVLGLSPGTKSAITQFITGVAARVP